MAFKNLPVSPKNSNDFTTIIYGMIDPRYDVLRYVGKTVFTLDWRKAGHMRDSQEKNTHKDYWVAQLLRRRLEPDIFEIETVHGDDWIEAERFWIAYFRSIGCNLVNHTDGGEGAAGWHHDAATKARISAGNLGKPKSPAHIAKILAGPGVFKKGQVAHNKGKTWSEEVRKKIGDVQRGIPKGPQSSEHRANHLIAMASRKKYVWTEAHRASFNAKMAAKRATGWSPRNGKVWSENASDS